MGQLWAAIIGKVLQSRHSSTTLVSTFWRVGRNNVADETTDLELAANCVPMFRYVSSFAHALVVEELSGGGGNQAETRGC
jgi:hypothetical protein